MKVQVTEKLHDENIVEVKTVYSDEDANKLLLKGWVLLHGGIAHIDSQGYNAKIHFVMGRTCPDL